MAGTVCYIKLSRNVEITTEDVYLKDLGSIRCADYKVSAKVKNIRVHKFRKNGSPLETGESPGSRQQGEGHNTNQGKQRFEEKRCIVTVLKIIELMEEACPGIVVESLGESEVLIERVNTETHKGWQQVIKAAMVAVISFCGTAFTIMAYHNDIGISDVFARIHEIIMGSEPQGVSALEAAYSAGMAFGIIIFFNHVGGRRLTKDPTPIEVEMRKYEMDVNTALVETAEREGKTIDVE